MTRELARQPHDVPGVFAERFNGGDLAAVLEVYEPDAVLIPEPGTAVRGESLRGALKQHLDLGLPITATPRQVVVSGDIALVVVDWNIKGADPQGKPFSLTGTATDVARRGSDGCWRYVIDNPFGTQ